MADMPFLSNISHLDYKTFSLMECTRLINATVVFDISVDKTVSHKAIKIADRITVYNSAAILSATGPLSLWWVKVGCIFCT